MGNDDPTRAIPMEYLNDEFWTASIEIRRKDLGKNLTYKYLLKNEEEQLPAVPGLLINHPPIFSKSKPPCSKKMRQFA